MSGAPFTRTGYVTLVGGLAERGYALRDFHSVDTSARHLVLRHDVDQCIATARKLADVETANHWKSTWFVLVRTEMYNPFSRSNTEHIRAMIRDGHEVGLHFDATHYEGDMALQRGSEIECRMLEDITGARVRVVSFHRPAKDLVGSDAPIAGRIHTYMPRFVNEMGYCSDSRGEWRFGFPWDHAAVVEGRALQLLTHAIWWVGPDNRSPRERLDDLLSAKMRDLDAELAANNDVWRAASAPS